MTLRRGALGGARHGFASRRVRELLAISLLVLLGALGSTATATAGTGLTPVDPVSPGAERSADIYYLILGFSAFIMLLVTIPLLLFVVRYRSRGRSRHVEGSQIRGNTRLELAWTALPVVILAIIAGFVFYKVPGINDIEAKAGGGGEGNLEIQVEGRQFYWQYVYPNGVVAIDTLRVPVGRVVNLELGAPESDVNHAFWIPALGGKFDAIPGETNHTSFRADRIGTYEGQCGEFCGIQHAAMAQAVEVVSGDQFDTWLASEARAQQSGSSDLGERTYQGACAKCHGMAGEGLIGPPLAGNSLLEDRDALETIVRNGQGAMPAVGEGWRDRQMDALFRYLGRDLARGEEGTSDGS